MHRTTLMLHVWKMWTVCRCSYIVYAGACAHPCWIASSLYAFEGWRCWGTAWEGAQEVYVDATMDYVFSCVENEPRDAGTDQRSSGIIRLHTIKQIIDRVRSHTYKGTKCNAWTHSLWIALLPPAGGLWYSMLYSRTFESPWNQEEASLYVFCRINMQCWILLLTQWIGWTMLSGIPSWCSWILTVSRVWRTWGPDCVLSPGRVPGNSMSVHLNWERSTTTYSQVNTDVLRLCFLYCKKKWKKDWERRWGLVHMQKQTLVPKARWY